jgi:hypothetical protein
MDAIQRMVRFAVPSRARRGSRIWRLSLAVCVLLVGAMSGAARADTACSPPTGSATAADAGSLTTPQAAPTTGLAAHCPAAHCPAARDPVGAARDPAGLDDHDAVGHRHCAVGKRSDGELIGRELGRFVL